MNTTIMKTARRLVRQSVEDLHAQLDIELTRGLDDVSTLGEIATVMGLAVALVARRTEYVAPSEGFGPDAAKVADEAVGLVVGADAEPWVAEWLRPVAVAEFERQRLAWNAMKHGGMVEYAKSLLEKLGLPNPPHGQVEALRRAAHPTGPVERTCRVVEDESRVDGRCACHNLPAVMRPCERCEVARG